MGNSISAWIRSELKKRSESATPEPFDVRFFKSYKPILSEFNAVSAIKWRAVKFTDAHVRITPIIAAEQPSKSDALPDDPYDDNNPERPYY